MKFKLHIEKDLSIEVFALMADWQEIRGHFYLGEHAQNHYGRENLLDVLNAPGKDFVPFTQDEQTPLLLIQRSRIVGLRPSCPDSADWPMMQENDGKNWHQAKMAFAGFTLEGCAYTGDMEPHRRRLSDLLNYGQTFFVFKTDEGPWIVNKDRLNHLVPLT